MNFSKFVFFKLNKIAINFFSGEKEKKKYKIIKFFPSGEGLGKQRKQY